MSEDQHVEDHEADAIELVIRARPRDLGGFSVRRALPSMRRRLVGPFIFWDHMGPVAFQPDSGMEVRPHPHISLATVTYLFEGAVFHRDSLGTAQVIRPGDVNWMVAGKGIAHSERTPPEDRPRLRSFHGIQAWVALQRSEEECEPSFVHHPASRLPLVKGPGFETRVISGTAFGVTAPAVTGTPTLYADAQLSRDAALAIDAGYEERALYVVSGEVACEGGTFDEGAMLVLAKGHATTLHAVTDARVMLLGGAPIDGKRHIWWNFVSSSEERIERAKADWKEGRFPKVPGDEAEFIPLPD